MILSSIFAAAELNYSRSTWILSLEFYAEKINCVPGVGVARGIFKRNHLTLFFFPMHPEQMEVI